MKKIIIITSLFIFIFSSCKKEESNQTNLTLQFTQTVNGNQIEYNKLIYTNSVNQIYSIKKLWYIISNIKLHKSDGSNILIKDIHFIDANDPSTLSFKYNNIPLGNYTSISFQMGLDTTSNISNIYVNEYFHTKMFWPEIMGGGYHFMKLEGNFNNDTNFYNIHTGSTMGTDYSFNNSHIIALVINQTKSDIKLSINMEVNNWLQNPNHVILSNDGIMGDMYMQMQIQQNGIDVFNTIIN